MRLTLKYVKQLGEPSRRHDYQMSIGKRESFAKLYLDVGTCIVFTQLMKLISLYWKHVSYHAFMHIAQMP